MIECAFTFDRPKVLHRCHDRGELEKAIADAQSSDREGVVLYFSDGWMVKVKSTHCLEVKSIRSVLKGILLKGRPVPTDDSSRSRLVRDVLERADRSRLVYHSKAFDEDDVDMTYVGSLIR